MRDVLFETTISSTYGVRSISWWLVRLLFLHQRVLDERSSSLFDLLQVFMSETLHHFGSLEKVTNYWGSQLKDEEVFSIVSIAHLEAGVIEHIYGRIDSCRWGTIDKFIYRWPYLYQHELWLKGCKPYLNMSLENNGFVYFIRKLQKKYFIRKLYWWMWGFSWGCRKRIVLIFFVFRGFLSFSFPQNKISLRETNEVLLLTVNVVVIFGYLSVSISWI